MKFLVLFSSLFFTIYLQADHLKNVEIPKDTKSDWMELKSGEWVRGKFKGIFSGKVEFDSKEFDLVKFDLDDVKQIITVGPSTINLNSEMPKLRSMYKLNVFSHKDNEILGNLNFRDNKFSVTLDDNSTNSLERESIASISGGEPRESNYWSAHVSLGIDILSGNTEQVSATIKADTERRTALTRFRADYLSSNTLIKVDENTTKTTADNTRFSSSFDLYQTSHFYWRIVGLEYSRDPFKNIEGKFTLSTGAGYDILYTDTIDWSVTMGPGYQETSYVTVLANEEVTVSTPLLFFDTRYTHEITDDVDIIVNYHMYYINEESGRYNHHFETTIKTEFINNFTINLSFFWDRTEYPETDNKGNTPGKDDYKTIFFVGYSY